jgi:adenosylcobinamide-phosphate guanylyltransferase
MKVPALIMAGGKGSRMGLPVEKPLVTFLGKPLIDRVLEAVESSRNISMFYVVTSCNTPETEKRCMLKGLKVMRTDGKGYHLDLKQAIIEANLSCPVLTISADLPTLTGEFLDKVIKAYEDCGLDALAVFVPIKSREALGLSVSSTDCFEGVSYAVSGVNMINGTRINDGVIPSGALITDEIAVLFNINTNGDLEKAEQAFKESDKFS